MQATKPKHAKGASNFQCKQFKYELPQGGTLDEDRNLIIQMTWLETIRMMKTP